MNYVYTPSAMMHLIIILYSFGEKIIPETELILIVMDGGVIIKNMALQGI